MFLKIKLDQTNGSNENVDPVFVEIADDSSIALVKKKISEFVQIEPGKQEIQTLTRCYNDSEKINDLLQDAERRDGAAVMLYQTDEPKRFLCFIQFYNNEEANVQRHYQQKSKTKTSTTTSSEIVLLDSSPEKSTQTRCSDSERESTSSSASSGSEDSSDSDATTIDKRKRKTVSKCETQQPKISKNSADSGHISSTLRTYLHEFADCAAGMDDNNNNNSDDASYNTVQSSYAQLPENTINATVHTKANNHDVGANNNNVLASTSTPLSTIHKRFSYDAYETPPQNLVSASLISPTEDMSNNITKSNDDDHPYMDIDPEMRPNIIVVSYKTDFTAQTCAEWLLIFFEKFQKSQLTAQLQFAEDKSITLFQGKLWIVCIDKETADWLCDNTNGHMNKLYKAEFIADFLQLQKCVIVLPDVGTTSRNMSNVFSLLAKQNDGLCTQDWMVEKRYTIKDADDEYYSSSVSCFCPNEVLFLLIDKKSIECVNKLKCKLKYCFWRVQIKIN